MMLLFLSVILFAAIKQAKALKRDPSVLMNQYYRFKSTNPEAAKKSLLIILSQDSQYLPALQEYRQWLFSANNPLPIKEVLTDIASSIPYYQLQATTELVGVTSYPSHLIPVKNSPERDMTTVAKHAVTGINELLNNYYSLKEKDQPAAQVAIRQAINQQPNNVQALQEAGYLALSQGHRIEAIDYFTRAYRVTHQPEIAMQLAYLCDQLNNKPAAYQYFKAATCSYDKRLALQAENALTNLAGQQTKALPRPYFSEIYFNPFSQSRFGLTVVPFMWRLGIEQDNRLRTKQYVFLRRTQDNRSENLGEISQIYEDNVQVTGIGVQFAPISRLPLVGFVEAGQAYDLVYRNRNRWRGDLRSGFMYFQEFGTRPAFFNTLRISHDYYSDWYGDVTYFSRYHNNVIGLVRTHQGIHLLQYRSSIVNLYVTGRVIADTQREFYNNIAEVGPGIALIPTNRFNLQLRFEHVNGVYLPAGGSVNPYGKYYTNQIIQLLFHVKI